MDFINNIKNKYLELLQPIQRTLSNAQQSWQKAPLVGGLAGQAVQRFQQLPQQVQATGQLVNQGLQDRSSQLGESIVSIPYRMADYGNYMTQKFGEPVNFNEMDKNEKRIGKIIQSKPVKQQDFWAEQFFRMPQQIKTSSAQLMPLINDITPVPPADPKLEAIKQQVLNNPMLRPAAKEYLSKIPVVYENMGDWGGRAKQKYIAVSDKIKSPQLIAIIIEHELLHKTPNLVPTSLFHPKNQEIVNNYTKRWGENYFNNNDPRTLIGEMFAEQDLPPAYYWHIFKNINPKASNQDFISYLKSWFENEINNPSLPTTPNPNVQRPFVVPNSGGQKIQ